MFLDRKGKNKQSNADKIINEIQKVYEQNLEEGEALARKKASQEAYGKIYKMNPKRAIEVLKAMDQTQIIPDDVVAEIGQKLFEKSDLRKMISSLAKELSDSMLSSIIDKTTINGCEVIELIKQLEDKKLREQKIRDQLQKFYENKMRMPDSVFVNQLKELNWEEKNQEIEILIEKCIAKKMAYNISQFAHCSIYHFSQMIPPEKMLEMGIENLVQQEYELLEKNKKEGYKLKMYETKYLREEILAQIASDVVSGYDQRIGEIYIPSSEAMKKISKEEENKLIERIKIEIRNKTGKELTIFQVRSIHGQIRGSIQNDGIKDLVHNLKKVPSSQLEQALDLVNSILQKDKDTIEIYQQMIDSEMTKLLVQMPEEKRKKAMVGIEHVLERRTNVAVAAQTPKIEKGSHWKKAIGRE